MNPMATALSAASNASRVPVTPGDILAILRTGDGPSNLVHAIFEDCIFETLDRIGADHAISRATLRAAYRTARRRHAVATNPEFEDDPAS